VDGSRYYKIGRTDYSNSNKWCERVLKSVQVKDSISYELRSTLVSVVWKQFYVILKFKGNLP